MRSEVPFGADQTHGVLDRKADQHRASSDRHGWRSIYASAQRERPFEAYFSAVDDPLIVLHRSGPASVERLTGDRASRHSVPAGGVHLVPGGTSFGFRLRDPLDTLHVYLRRTVIAELAAEMAEGDPGRVALTPGFLDSDLQLQNLLHAVFHALDGGDHATALYVDCLARALAAHMVRAHSNARLRAAPASEAGGDPMVAEAIGFMRAHLDRTLGLEEIAGVVGRSPGHFARQFRATTGVPPYRYIMGLRLEKAGRMLAGTRLPIAEIALDCGFTHQEHMTRLFRRAYGTTPAAYRRARQN